MKSDAAYTCRPQIVHVMGCDVMPFFLYHHAGVGCRTGAHGICALIADEDVSVCARYKGLDMAFV